MRKRNFASVSMCFAALRLRHAGMTLSIVLARWDSEPPIRSLWEEANVIDQRSICATCGHTHDWHDPASPRQRLRSDLGIERPCYREIGGAACRCGGFRDSGEVAVPGTATPLGRSAAPTEARLVRNAALTILLVLMGLALLYAYRSQTPALATISTSQAVSEIQSGQVRRVTVQADLATLELKSGERQQTRLPAQSDLMTRTVLDYNTAHPGDQIELRYESETTGLSTIASVLLSLLPVILIGGFFYLMWQRAARR